MARRNIRMLQEVTAVRQIPNEPYRRFFTDDTFDLMVWQAADGTLTGFQLCYRLGAPAKALTWQRHAGFSHYTIDDGEERSFRHKMTPVLLPDGVFDKDRIGDAFWKASETLDPVIRRFVSHTLTAYHAPT